MARKKKPRFKYEIGVAFDGVWYSAKISKRNELNIYHNFVDATGGFLPNIEYALFYYKKFETEEDAMKHILFLENNHWKFEELLSKHSEKRRSKNYVGRLKQELKEYRKMVEARE